MVDYHESYIYEDVETIVNDDGAADEILQQATKHMQILFITSRTTIPILNWWRAALNSLLVIHLAECWYVATQDHTHQKD